MNGPAELSNLVLTRRLADGTIEWIPLGIPQRIPTASGEAYALIDRANYEAPQKLVAQRQGDDLLVEVSSTEVLVLGGFFAMPGAAFYPTPDIAGGAGPFSGPKLHPESPLLEGYPAGEQLVWSAEPAPIDEPGAVVDPGSRAGSPLLWGGLAAGALGVAAIAGGGGGGGGSSGSSSNTGSSSGDTAAPVITSGTTAQSTPENSGAGQVVYTAAGTDDGAITWSLATGGDSADFSIDASSGAVTLTGNPDFETKSSYSFTVVATDPAGNRSQRTVSLSIVDQDETAPSVVSVALTSAVGAQNNTLNAGDVVGVTVTMSKNTNVGGTPRIALNIGGSTEFANYASGSGSTSLVFQYTVQPGDTDNNGIAIRADSLQLNGGSLADASGNTAVLGHASVSNNAAFVVDTTAPGLSSSNPADNATDVPVGGNIVLTFNDEMRAGSGNVTISNGSDTRTFSATDTTQVSFSGNQVTIDPATDLNGNTTYNVQIENGALTDEAGNAYTGISNSTTLNFATEIVVDTSIVVFDLVQGSSSNHSGRTFQSGVSYDIYVRVDSNNDNLRSLSGSERWAGAVNLGTDDRIILVGDGSAVEGPFGNVNQMLVSPTRVAWRSAFGLSAGELQGESFTRRTNLGAGDNAALFDTTPPGAFFGGQGGQLNTMYAFNLPAGILTSQGLV